MLRRQAFKRDESFVEKLAMGAIATQQVCEHLRVWGHMPVELERGSMGFKVWKRVKIKRIRVPDLLCVACGRKVDSRAKTSFELSMSHSLADPERGWDSGFEDRDFVAFVICDRVGDRPAEWRAQQLVQYVSVGDLRRAQAGGQALVVKPKGVEEGFEARIRWPAAVAHHPGEVMLVSPESVQYRRHGDGKVLTTKLARQGVRLSPLVAPGKTVKKNQVLAATVPVVLGFECTHDQSQHDYVSMLCSPSLPQRYAAAKALSHFPSLDTERLLKDKLQDTTEHVYVRVEAAATLARLGLAAGREFISRCLQDEYLQNRLEAVIVLGEVADGPSCDMLIDVLLDRTQHSEIRAAAAWALGEVRTGKALSALVQSVSTLDEEVRTEAARALAKLASRFNRELVETFRTAVPVVRPGVAWALARGGQVQVSDLLGALQDEDARQWAAYLLGSQGPEKYLREIENLRTRDPEVYFAVTVLWKIMSSWVYKLEEY